MRAQVQLSVYRLDLELLFSAQPFSTAAAATCGGTAASRGAAPASAATSNFSYVRPSHTSTLEVPLPGSPPDALPSGVAVQAPPGGAAAAAAAAAAGAVRLVVDLGVLFADLQDTSCVMVEAASGGLLARRPQYRARLAVRAYEQQGVLNVLQAATGEEAQEGVRLTNTAYLLRHKPAARMRWQRLPAILHLVIRLCVFLACVFHPHAHLTKLPSYMEHHLGCTPY